MAFFVLIPLFWLASVMLYAASPRQQIAQQHKQAILPVSTAWISFCIVNIASFIWLTLNGWSMIVAAIDLLLINMLMLPSSIILLAHQPHWLKHGTISIVGLCILAQLISQGQ
ncbi:hypothetical protein [Aliikangiella sp. IMCC44359]|uniref:hypothetical protein n=1 Tax=Aliikangiella sp. IMCC44359 TaxID=3459125 RepID=UPI00403AD5B0